MNIDKTFRDTVAIRKIYAHWVEDGSLTTIFRPGRRLLSEDHSKAFGVGQEVRVRIVDKVGADWANIYPVFLPEPNRPAIIINVTPRPFDALTDEDFVGSTPDVNDQAGLRIQLGLIYNLASEELCSGLWVTRTTFRYVDAPLLDQTQS